MRRAYFHLSLCLCLIALIKFTCFLAYAPIVPDYLILHPDGTSEGSLAFGEKLKFKSLGIYELELLPSISDTLAGELVKEKSRILAKSKKLSLASQFQAFEVAKGIGPKKAKQLALYLDF